MTVRVDRAASDPRPAIEIVVPVHNEAASIEATLREFYRVSTQEGLDVSFQVCEDGSSDGSAEVVAGLAADVPIALTSSSDRKGYSRAVLDGLRATTRPVVGFIDGDGQCDPTDLVHLVDALGGADLVVGYRHPRADGWYRCALSWGFRVLYRLLFPVRLRDPSVPYGLIRRPALERILSGRVGFLPQGFWWEFNARAAAAGIVAREVPIGHRVRSAGATQVYRPSKMPRVAFEHVVGLWRLRRDLS